MGVFFFFFFFFKGSWVWGGLGFGGFCGWLVVLISRFKLGCFGGFVVCLGWDCRFGFVGLVG